MRHSDKHDGHSNRTAYVMAAGLAFAAAYLSQGTANVTELAIASAAISLISLIVFRDRARSGVPIRVPVRAQRRAGRRE